MMGLSIVVTDYSGKVFERINDPKNFLHKLLPPADEESAAILTKIDWYGDTYFNYLQVGQFLREWDRLAQSAETPEENELIHEVVHLAKRCQKERTLLRFIGD
jgi:hypothetical protein